MITDSVQQVKDTVKSVADNQSAHTSFTDLSEIAREDVKEASEAAEDTVEEFFDDEDPAQ